jgi:hypothetical protein
MTIERRVSPDEPEGGWLGPRGGNGFPDLEELDQRQRDAEAARVAACQMSSCKRHQRCMYLNHPRGCKR